MKRLDEVVKEQKAEQEAVEQVAETPTCSTNWKVFEDAHLMPIEVICDGYVVTGAAVHPYNQGCHTRLAPTAEAMIRHMKGGHGGGFKVKLAQWNGKPWAGWQQLADAGIELTDLRCDWCEQEVPLHRGYIKQHLTAHAGKMKGRRASVEYWLMTISEEPPLPGPDEIQ